MSGPWRITVESWVTKDADWYGRRVFVVDANDFPAALRVVAELPPAAYLDEDALSLHSGVAPDVDEVAE